MRVYPLSLNVDQISRPARREQINLKPQYQRTHEGVWTLKKKQLLMDTILRGYDIPKIYFRKIKNGSYNHEVVDGQQRLRALWEFIDDKYPLGRVSSDLSNDLEGKHYPELGSNLLDSFGSFGLSVLEIQDAEEPEIRDLFLRLQEGASLNPAEKRNAMMGNLRDFVAATAGESKEPHPVFGLTWIRPTRNAWDDIAAHALRLELEGGPADITADNLKKMYEVHATFDPNGAVAKKFTKTLNYMARVLKEHPPEMDIKWGFVDLYLAISTMDGSYVMSGRESDVAAAFISFENERRDAIASADLTELLSSGHDEWDRDLYNYIQAFQREGNKKKNVEERHQVYLRRLLREIGPDSKDPKRAFTRDEKVVLYRMAGGQCQICSKPIDFDVAHADHIKPHSLGGATTVSNGQILCPSCNLSKGKKL